MASRTDKRALLERIEHLSQQHLGQRDEGLQAAIDRSDRWLMGLFESGAAEHLMRCNAYADFFEAAGAPRVVRVVGRPADDEALAAAEASLGFALPRALRDLLAEVGQLVFMDRQVIAGAAVCQPTVAVDQLAAMHRRFEARLAPVLQGYDERYDELNEIYRPNEPGWQRWGLNSGGVFSPEAMAGARFLPICPYYDEAAHLMALHLGDGDDAPVFIGGGNDEPYFFVATGSGLQGWISAMVDRVIDEVTTSLSMVLE